MIFINALNAYAVALIYLRTLIPLLQQLSEKTICH